MVKRADTHVSNKGEATMDTFTASNLSPLVNAYTISNGNPRSAIRLSETVKTGEGQQRDTHPDDNC